MIADQVAALDLGLFSHIESQTTDADRRSLLAIHDAVGSRLGSFSYLEIGSHLGGSLQALIADPRCRTIVSIDPRPLWMPDDRPGVDGFDYPDNSTGRMLGMLRDVPGADLSKLRTIDKSTEDIDPGQLEKADFC